MDFVFGTLINDELKVASHRALRRGVQHQHHITPVDPTPQDTVTVHLITGADIIAEHATLYYTVDDSPPQGTRGEAINGMVVRFRKVRVEWDTLIWGYLTHWEATIPPQPDQTMVRYQISVWSDSGAEWYADWPDAEAAVEHSAMVYFGNIPQTTPYTPEAPHKGYVFNYHVDTLKTPEWAKNATIYHVFVDRFYHGDGQTWRQTSDLSDFCGGTLWGVRDKLDYITDLGVDCIWLSPTWDSPTSHGYDVTDFTRTAAHLGGDDALRAVINGAHEHNLRVILDMPCNHISNQHPIFVEALNNKNSRYREWFTFDDSKHGYKAFFNVASMPEINLAHPDARDWMINNALHWLTHFDIDGYRLDYANGPGPDFWSSFRRACKSVKQDCLLFGEIIDSPDKLYRYTGRLDGCLDFAVNDVLRRTFAWKSLDKTQLTAFITAHDAYFDGDFMRPVFLDNHDMDRFLYIADGDKTMLREAVAVQMQRPHPVIIYYGTEIGLSQKISTREKGLDMCRVPMIWDDGQDVDLLAFYRDEIRARKQRFAYKNVEVSS